MSTLLDSFGWYENYADMRQISRRKITKFKYVCMYRAPRARRQLRLTGHLELGDGVVVWTSKREAGNLRGDAGACAVVNTCSLGPADSGTQ